MCVWRHNQQFFTHEAALGSVVQIVENGLIRFGKRSFNVVNFQRLDWISGSFHTTLELARLVQIPNIHKRGELFFPFPNRPQIRCRWLCINIFFFDGNGGFLAGKACYLVVQSGHNFRKPFYPRRGPLALGQAHFNGVLVPEQALSQGAVETFNNGLVSTRPRRMYVL